MFVITPAERSNDSWVILIVNYIVELFSAPLAPFAVHFPGNIWGDWKATRDGMLLCRVSSMLLRGKALKTLSSCHKNTIVSVECTTSLFFIFLNKKPSTGLLALQHNL